MTNVRIKGDLHFDSKSSQLSLFCEISGKLQNKEIFLDSDTA